MTSETAVTHPAQRLETEVSRLRAFLDRDAFFTLSPGERDFLKQQSDEILRKLASIESSFLTIGFLGGTGVGKSTIMNALAGSEIASTSHRRPHTDHVLIYRHEEAPALRGLTPEEVPWREILHDNDAIKQVLLCDLPDFDSLMGENREHVQRFLQRLDLLVWVTSPEKYADARFYDFLRSAPKARRNFYFVLNKADVLFEGDGLESGYKKMEAVSRSFLGHVRESGIEEPFFYMTAAEQVLLSRDAAPWNQFPSFRQQIFQQRDMKQVTAIKSANLDEELQRIVSRLEQEGAALENFGDILEDALRELREERPQWARAGQEAVDLWATRLDRDLSSYQTDPSHLLGPGYAVALVFLEWERRSPSEPAPPSDRVPFVLPEEIALMLERRLTWMEDRLNRQVLRKNLPASFRDRLREAVDVSRVLEDLREQFAQTLGLRAVGPSPASVWRFKGVQILWYLLFFCLFLLTLGGEAAWQRLFQDPGFRNAFRLVLDVFYTLFSAKGLAALVSYALINLFLGMRFFRRYRTLLRRSTAKTLQHLKKDLQKLWEAKLDQMLRGLEGLRDEMREKAAALSALDGKKRKVQ